MKCKDSNCRKGHVDEKACYLIRTPCRDFFLAYPCNICGRLHHKDGDPLKEGRGDKFYIKDGKMVNKEGKEYPYYYSCQKLKKPS